MESCASSRLRQKSCASSRFLANFYYNKKNYDDYNCFLKKCTTINSNGVHHFVKSIHSNRQYCKYCGCLFFKNSGNKD